MPNIDRCWHSLENLHKILFIGLSKCSQQCAMCTLYGNSYDHFWPSLSGGLIYLGTSNIYSNSNSNEFIRLLQINWYCKFIRTECDGFIQFNIRAISFESICHKNNYNLKLDRRFIGMSTGVYRNCYYMKSQSILLATQLIIRILSLIFQFPNSGTLMFYRKIHQFDFDWRYIFILDYGFNNLNCI